MACISLGSDRRILRFGTVQTLPQVEDPAAEQLKTGKEELGLAAATPPRLVALKASLLSEPSVMQAPKQAWAQLARSKLEFEQAGRCEWELETVAHILAPQAHALEDSSVQAAQIPVCGSQAQETGGALVLSLVAGSL